MCETEPTGDSPRTSAEEASSENDTGALDYWHAQVRAALDGMEPDTAITKMEQTGEIAIVTTDGWPDRDQAAELIHALERRGFSVTVTTGKVASGAEPIKIDASESPLSHPFDRSVSHPQEGDA